MIDIRRAKPDDLPAIEDLLIRCGLPADGLAAHVGTALVARAEGIVVGSAALEVYPDGALLRSVAVEEAHRGTGLGQHLTDAALALAREHNADAVYLLTETASDFFGRFYGFQSVERADVPAGVRTSVEFTTACPDSALAMRAAL